MTRQGEKTESTREREKRREDRWTERKTDKGSEEWVMERKASGTR